MKKIFIFYALVLVMALTSCKDGGDDTQQLTQVDTSSYTVRKSIASMQQTKIVVQGKGNDLLTITIPKLPFGQAKDIDVEFKLVYGDDNILPEIVIDTHIEFDTAVTIEFQSDNFTKDDLFIYKGNRRNYLVPFSRKGNLYTAKVMHFSRWQYEDTPTTFVEADTAVKEGLSKLGEYQGDDGISGLNSDLIGDILGYINIVEQVEPTLGHTYMNELIATINSAVKRWMKKMNRTSVPFWDGYCVHSEFKTFITNLVHTMTELELIGSNYDIGKEVAALLQYHFEAAYKEWKTITPPRPCETEDLIKYINCAIKFAREAELGGIDISGEEQTQIVVDYVEGNINAVLDSSSCEDVECIQFYLSMSQRNEFEYMGIGHDYTQELEDKLSDLKKKCTNSCKYIWNINFTQNFTANESGESLKYVTNFVFKNVFIYPRSDYTLTNEEKEACSAHLDGSGWAKNITATSYDAVEGTDNHYQQGPPTFKYAGLSPDGLDGRDPDPEIMFNQLDAAYIAGKDAYDNGNSWDGWATTISDVYGPTVYRDIFEEIYLHTAFSVGDNKGKFTFTPVGSK